MMELQTRTLPCGVLFTQGGDGKTVVTESDILEPSEALRRQMDCYSHAPDTTDMLERLAGDRPEVLACMHGSAWRGDGAKGGPIGLRRLVPYPAADVRWHPHRRSAFPRLPWIGV